MIYCGRIGHFSEAKKYGHIGLVDESFVDHMWRGAGSMCILGSTSSRSMLYADGLVAQLVHRARPIEGGVASQCASAVCSAGALAHALALAHTVWSGLVP